MGFETPATGIPVVHASQVVLVRPLQNFVWRVTVGGEDMVCKTSIDIFKHAIDDELAAYLRIRLSKVELSVP